MWILTAIFQAIGQAITWILPVSESGHSVIFHNFSGRYTDACSQLTGVIHISIAIGLIVAFYKLFISLFKNFFSSWNDIFHKRLDLKNITPQRNFMYMTILSFVLFIFYLIPAGEHGNVYSLFHRTSYNETVFGEGICFALLGVLIIAACGLINKKFNKLPDWATAIILGIIGFLALPTGGCAFLGGIFAVGIMLGMSQKYALRYAVVMSVPVLIVMGIIELCTAVTSITIASAIIALIVGVAVSFFTVKLFVYILKKSALKYFGYYDISIGIVCIIIGIFQLVIK